MTVNLCKMNHYLRYLHHKVDTKISQLFDQEDLGTILLSMMPLKWQTKVKLLSAGPSTGDIITVINKLETNEAHMAVTKRSKSPTNTVRQATKNFHRSLRGK